MAFPHVHPSHEHFQNCKLLQPSQLPTRSGPRASPSLRGHSRRSTTFPASIPPPVIRLYRPHGPRNVRFTVPAKKRLANTSARAERQTRRRWTLTEDRVLKTVATLALSCLSAILCLPPIWNDPHIPNSLGSNRSRITIRAANNATLDGQTSPCARNGLPHMVVVQWSECRARNLRAFLERRRRASRPRLPLPKVDAVSGRLPKCELHYNKHRI